MASLAEGSIVGRYQIRSLLGAGGMGEVYLARDLSLDREVALKILPHELTSDPHRVQRFVTEAKAASALNHAAIVTIYEIGQYEELHYIAMELVDGLTLDEWIRQRQPPLSSIFAQLAQIALGLAQAHARGIVHRDLKPDNIMITDGGQPKILDFGIAKLVSAERGSDSPAAGRTLTESRALLGTVGYMSPEQIEGLPLDHRADIFSFGCIVYESVTGQPPFAGDTNAATLHNVVHREPEPIANDGLQRIVQRCLAKKREDRYASAHDLGLDLQQASALETKPRRLARIRRAIRPALIRVAAAIAIVAAGALLLRIPASAVVDPSKDPEMVRLQSLLVAERRALNDREREVARRGIEIERLRAERDQTERLRAELESSYRKLLGDVGDHLRRNDSERSKLSERVVAAETELRNIRDEAEKHNAQQEDLRAIAQALSSVLEARLDAHSLELTIPGTYFRHARGVVAWEGEGVLKRVAEQIAAHPDLMVTIEGHADSSGSSAGNLGLSIERANRVRDQLVWAGVDVARITTIGRGEDSPLFSNDTDEGRAANRRVEILLAY